MGYAIAWGRRRALLSVLVPVLVPAELIVLALRLLASPGDAALVNGELVVPAPDGLLGLLDTAIAGAAWLLGITAAIISVGSPFLGTKEVLKKAAKALPAQAGWALGATGVAIMTLLIAGLLGLPLVIPILIALAIVLARFSLFLPSNALDGGPSWSLAEGRTFRVAARIITGAVLVPAVVIGGTDRLGDALLVLMPSVATRIAVRALGTLLFVAVVAVQAGTFASVYLDLRGEPVPEASAGIGRGWVALIALAPALAVAVVAPSAGPLVKVRPDALPDWAEQIAVVPGQPPVIFTRGNSYRCDNDACTGGKQGLGGIAWGRSTAGVGNDGAILSASFSRNPDDVLAVGRCAADCAGGSVTLLENAALKPLPRFAVAASSSGVVWIALAQQKSEQEPKIELSLIRCGDAKCEQSRRIVAGTVEGGLSRSGWDREVTVQLRLTPGDVPVAEYNFGYESLTRVSCDSPDCGKTSASTVDRKPDFPLGAGNVQAATVTDRGLFYVTAEPPPPREGPNIRIGAVEPQRDWLILWHCTDTSCRDKRRIPLYVAETRQRATSRLLPQRVHIAALPSGTVLITVNATIVSLQL